MRIDLAPIIKAANNLLAEIEAKQRGPARDAAHHLICELPLPSWADPTPGITILYGPEGPMAEHLEALRYSACTWSKWLYRVDDPGNEWPQPIALTEATRALEEMTGQNASVSANTAPTTS